MSEHTPGPWGWFGSNHGIYLATPDRGRLYVMGFDRLGMQSAQPTFKHGDRLVPAKDLVKFQVGNPEVTGFSEARADPSVYRYDIIDIDNPNARLIAAAPELLEALEKLNNVLDRDMVNRIPLHVFEKVGNALRKAKGTPPEQETGG